MENKTIICKDCGKEFVFTVGEQNFYKEKNFSDPVRCKECRRTKNNKNNNTNKLTEDEITEILNRWKANTIKL